MKEKSRHTGWIASNTILVSEPQKKEANLLSEAEYVNIYNATINNKGACLQGGHHNSEPGSS